MNLSDIATDLTEVAKRIYLLAVDAIPSMTPLTAQFERTRKFEAGPDGVYFNAKLEIGGAVAVLPDGVLLPRPTKPKRKQGKIQLVHEYTTVAVGGQSVALSANPRQAFVSNLEDNLQDGLKRVARDVERQINGDGRGVLCTLETVANAPTYDVEKPFGKANAGPGTMLLVEDMDVAVINPADGTERGRAKISSVDVDNDKITLSAAVSGAAIGDYVVLCNDVTATGTDAVNNYAKEAAGILAAISKGDTFENIDGTAFRRWNAVIMDNSGTPRSVTEKLIQTLEARIYTASGQRPTLHYTSPGLVIDLTEQLAGLRRFTGETVQLKSNYQGIKINDRTVIEGPLCPKGHWFALNTDRDVVGMLDLPGKGPGYVDLDGAKLHRIEGRHAWRADYWMPWGVIWFLRNAHGVLKDLVDDNTIVM